jgi:excisionase family DNA binding protein
MAENKRPQKPFMTSHEAAVRLMVDPKTIRNYHKAGRLEGVKTLGGHLRFSRAHIEGHASRMANFDEGTK